MSYVFPTRSLALLMAIGFVDLIATALLHHQGLIVELNPIMRPFLERSTWLFAVVKGATLAIAWIVMARHAKHNKEFVRKVCTFGSVAYIGLWILWFNSGR